MLDLKFTFPAFSRRPIRLSHHPEVKLVCVLTMIVKLFYPFDAEERYTMTPTEPAALVVDWDAWNSARIRWIARSGRYGRQRTNERYLDVTEDDVLDMTEPEIDNYLNWFGKHWIEEETQAQSTEADFRRALYRMFPVQADGQDTVTGHDEEMDEAMRERLERLHVSQSSLILREVIPAQEGEDSRTQDPLRPGSLYKHYRTEDDVPERARPFLTAAAELVGLEMDSFLIALFQVERKWQRWSDEERKRAGDVQPESDAGMDLEE